jgi:hypothetical protein
MKIINVHFDKNDNLGDWAAAPGQYYSFIDEIVDWSWRPTEECFVIFGGGGHIMRPEDKDLLEIMSDSLVLGSCIWGGGHNKEIAKPGKYPPYVTQQNLTGLRDANRFLPDGVMHVPCVSCMHPIFDATHKIKHDTVLYLHKFTRHINEQFKDVPRLMNHGGSHEDLAKAISFIGTGRYVFTNSYHGIYWSALLGRKAILMATPNTRFTMTNIPHIVAGSIDIKKYKKFAKVSKSGYLSRCRNANTQFVEKLGEVFEEITER